MKISQKYQSIIDELEPFIFSYEGSLKEFELNTLSSKEPHHFDPLKQESRHFFDYLKALDGLSFGGAGMGMDNWVFLDCAIMPSAVIGFAIHSSKASDEILETFKVKKDYEGLIPLSMFIAIPMAKRDCWFAHNLSSANSFLKEQRPGLGLLTKVLGLEVLKIKNLMGATQWDNSSLHVHTKIAKLKLESAYTPVHSHPESLVYSCEITKDKLESAIGVKEKMSGLKPFKFSSLDNILSLDKAIKKGEEIYLVSGVKRGDDGEYVELLYSKS